MISPTHPPTPYYTHSQIDLRNSSDFLTTYNCSLFLFLFLSQPRIRRRKEIKKKKKKMMIESRSSRRRTWPNYFSPCNNSNSNGSSSSSTTNRALHHINDDHSLSSSSLTHSHSSSFKTNPSSYSVDFITQGIRKQQLDSSVDDNSCPANWKSMNSFSEICPSSQTHDDPPPSPNWSISRSNRNIHSSTTPMNNNNSPDIISFSSTTSDIFYSQVSSTQFSTPRNKSSSSSSCTHTSTDQDQIEQEMMSTTITNNEDFHSFYQHSSQSKEGEADHVKQEYSPNKRWSLSSAEGGFRSSIERCQPLLGMPLIVVSEEQQKNDKDDDDDQSRSPMYEHHSRLVSRPKPYQDFLDEIRRKELEAKYNTWKEAKQLKLMNRLRMKEAEIDAWELKQRRKAKIEMKKIEDKLDRKRSKAVEEIQKKISNIKKKAEKMKARERQLVESKISMNSQITDKIKGTLKCFCC